MMLQKIIENNMDLVSSHRGFPVYVHELNQFQC